MTGRGMLAYRKPMCMCVWTLIGRKELEKSNVCVLRDGTNGKD